MGINLISLHASGVQHTIGKLSIRATILLKTSSQLEVYRQNYGALKSRESQLWEFWDSHLGVPGKKCHLDVDLVERHKVYYKGEGGGFPQVRAMASLVSPSLPMVRFNTKSAQTMH
jgi:hypothetical protein